MLAVIEQLQADPALKDKLLEHDFGAGASQGVSVMKWLDVKNVDRVPLWRLKSWDLEKEGLKYRFIYFYYWRNQTFNVLAVVPRNELNYDDPEHPIRKRVIATVKRLFPNG